MTEPQAPRLLDRVRDTLHLKRTSLKTEKSYLYYIKEFIIFHNEDRITTLPKLTIEGLKLQLENARYLHQQERFTLYIVS